MIYSEFPSLGGFSWRSVARYVGSLSSNSNIDLRCNLYLTGKAIPNVDRTKVARMPLGEKKTMRRINECISIRQFFHVGQVMHKPRGVTRLYCLINQNEPCLATAVSRSFLSESLSHLGMPCGTTIIPKSILPYALLDYFKPSQFSCEPTNTTRKRLHDRKSVFLLPSSFKGSRMNRKGFESSRQVYKLRFELWTLLHPEVFVTY